MPREVTAVGNKTSSYSLPPRACVEIDDVIDVLSKSIRAHAKNVDETTTPIKSVIGTN